MGGDRKGQSEVDRSESLADRGLPSELAESYEYEDLTQSFRSPTQELKTVLAIAVQFLVLHST